MSCSQGGRINNWVVGVNELLKKNDNSFVLATGNKKEACNSSTIQQI